MIVLAIFAMLMSLSVCDAVALKRPFYAACISGTMSCKAFAPSPLPNAKSATALSAHENPLSYAETLDSLERQYSLGPPAGENDFDFAEAHAVRTEFWRSDSVFLTRWDFLKVREKLINNLAERKISPGEAAEVAMRHGFVDILAKVDKKLQLSFQQFSLYIIHNVLQSGFPNDIEIARGVEYFARHHPEYLIATDENVQTPLHLAVEHGLYRVAQVLIKAGVNVNALDKTHESPIFKLVRLLNRFHDHALPRKFVALFVNAGANLDIENNVGRTPRQVVDFFRRGRFDEDDDGLFANPFDFGFKAYNAAMDAAFRNF